jgi:LAS superfamily LD-carboxypeptidase LdcB
MIPYLSTRKQLALFVIGSIVLLGLIAYGGYSYWKLTLSYADAKERLDNTLAENSELRAKLTNASATLETFAGTIGDISSTVGNLQKLKELDPELLKKYSKVYFLNENYLPKGLTEIEAKYAYADKKMLFLEDAYPFLKSMLDDSEKEGLSLKIVSAYRSFAEQSGLKSAYTVTYGSGANKFSADQGYSEHQLGTTIDFTNPKVGATFVGFDKTKEYAWLVENAYKYGFILSYPPGNSYYINEPWHWRFVGKALANRLHIEKENFYDLTERQIDPYLLKLFDN